MTEKPYRQIDIRTWSRKELFHHFLNFEDPFFNITSSVDVTRLMDFCKKENQSFFLSYMFFATNAANEIPEFRLRLLHKHLVEYPVIHSGSTILNPDDTFSFCYFDQDDNLYRFLEKGRIAIEELRKKGGVEPREDQLDMIHCSTIPWLSFTSFKHARRGGQEDSIPKLVFGKVYEDHGKKWMPVSVEVHHALMDGLHVGRFFECFQQKIRTL
ncbi:MAG: chloramphenicol acetyltransferase [Saprospiraceae bacterium]|nr:chloramphenicol acetyltransferase [Saprospiraceae bacterium]